MYLDVKTRYIGNLLSIVGYVVLVHVDPLWGSIIKIIGLGLATPFCIRTKLWDVVILFGIFIFIDLTNIMRILFNY